MNMWRAFEKVQDTPCSVCLDLASRGIIQPRAVMPLPEFPAMLRQDGRKCCRDCQATETTMAVEMGQHPMFEPARVTVANERVEGMLMPKGMMERFGLCALGYIAPASLEDLPSYIEWLEKHGIPNSAGIQPFDMVVA